MYLRIKNCSLKISGISSLLAHSYVHIEDGKIPQQMVHSYRCIIGGQ